MSQRLRGMTNKFVGGIGIRRSRTLPGNQGSRHHHGQGFLGRAFRGLGVQQVTASVEVAFEFALE